jgi:hypothetical protein
VDTPWQLPASRDRRNIRSTPRRCRVLENAALALVRHQSERDIRVHSLSASESRASVLRQSKRATQKRLRHNHRFQALDVTFRPSFFSGTAQPSLGIYSETAAAPEPPPPITPVKEAQQAPEKEKQAERAERRRAEAEERARRKMYAERKARREAARVARQQQEQQPQERRQQPGIVAFGSDGDQSRGGAGFFFGN